MSFDAYKYEGQIRAILEAPGVDLSTISAKRVRKQLVEQNDDLTPELVKEHKDELDLLIGNVYEQVSAAVGGELEDEGEASPAGENGKRKREEGDVGDVQASPSSAKKVKRGPKGEPLTDEELARQISNELNGRERHTRAAAPKAVKAKRGKKAKSSEVVPSEGEGEGSGEDKPKRRGGFTKEYALSEPLAALLEADKMSRPQVVKRIWQYIKGRNLQNPQDRREIICDDKMKLVFGVDKIGMFKMNKMLGEHLYEPTA